MENRGRCRSDRPGGYYDYSQEEQQLRLRKNVVYLSDPLVGNTTYRLDAFKEVFEDMGSQAIVISNPE